MRINPDNKTMDMERRDLNYILPAYVRSYQFHSKNEVPAKIIFPMFASVKAAGVDIPIEWVPPLGEIAVEIAKDGSNVAEITPEQEAVLDEKDEEIVRLKAEVAELAKNQPLKPAPEDLLRQEEESQPEPTEPMSPAKAAFAAELEPEDEPPVPTGDQIADYERQKREDRGEPEPDKPTIPPTATPDRQPKQPPGGDIGPGQGLSDMHSRDRRDQARTASDLAEEPDIEGTDEKAFEKEVKRDAQGNPIVEDRSE